MLLNCCPFKPEQREIITSFSQKKHFIATKFDCGNDETKEAYNWLTEDQLQAALKYYELFTAEIDERIERNKSLTEKKIRELAPFTAGGRQ